MEKITKHPITGVEFDLVEGEDAFTHAEPLRAAREYRALDPAEVEMLIRNRNYAPDWNDVFVSEPFDTGIVQNCRFYGKVRLGVTMPMVLEFEGQRLPAGLYDSTFVSCEIGDHVAIHHAHYLAHCVVGDEVIIANAGRIMTTPRARFGAGGLKEGETADKRTWIDVGNARGGRRILPFPGMIAADAWLWSRFPHETDLTARLTAMTDVAIDPRHGIYSRIGRRAVIRDCQAIIDVFVGPEATIDGAVLLQNLNVRSAVNEKTWIGQGSILVDGIVGLGCRVEASQARRFVLGNCSRLLEGARLAHTFLGDNSTVAGCEMQNNLVFPNHEQHHSNSFLIAASLLGQSNVAAGATIGSNHNSRLDDGELLAGRGFWPGLCSSFKHPCRFASFTLAAKGDYPAELDVPLPFSLVATNEHAQCLAILPAYWFLYNMYAVVRNDWKFRARDRRIHRVQHIEYDSLAPDTIEEIFTAVELIERWTGDALLRKKDIPSDEVPVEDRRQMGRSLLRDDPETASELDILGEAVENSPRRAVVRKAEKAWIMYRDMVLYYAMRNLVLWMSDQKIKDPLLLSTQLRGPRVRDWVNMGGQLVARLDLEQLKQRIVAGEMANWAAVHEEYERLWEKYPLDKARHAFASLLDIEAIELAALDEKRWTGLLERAVALQRTVLELAESSRRKDFTTAFRRITFASAEEMAAVQGRFEDDPNIARLREETAEFERLAGQFESTLHTPA